VSEYEFHVSLKASEFSAKVHLCGVLAL